MVGAIVVRTGGTEGEPDILLGRTGEGGELSLPTGFVASEETHETAMARVLESTTAWQPEPGTGSVVFEDYIYDARQTDHAWIEIQAQMFNLGNDSGQVRFRPGHGFEEIEWYRLDARTINRLPSNQARLVREAVTKLRETDSIEKALVASLLANTG
jgi:ADP-ribose pyrophosphatase YjhB (NUDIX family)